MPDASVFDATNLTCTSTPVPDAGGDNHVPVSPDGVGNFTSVDELAFLQVCGPGQQQTSVRSADQIVKVHNNQTTKVQGVVFLESEEKLIHLKAAEEIVIEVGKSKLRMLKDGTIELTGVRILSEATSTNTIKGGDSVLSEAGSNNTIKGGMVDINP